MPDNYTHIVDLAKETQAPKDGILTRALYNDERVKAVLFAFASGEELSEHSAAMPAILHVLGGNGTITLGSDTIEAQAGTWVHMPANLKHSIKTASPMLMLLLMLKDQTSAY